LLLLLLLIILVFFIITVCQGMRVHLQEKSSMAAGAQQLFCASRHRHHGAREQTPLATTAAC
jgi:hypothetical protein